MRDKKINICQIKKAYLLIHLLLFVIVVLDAPLNTKVILISMVMWTALT